MTAIESAVLLNIRSVLTYEVSRYEASQTYWQSGDGASKSNADKNVKYNASRIEALSTAIKQIDLLTSNPS